MNKLVLPSFRPCIIEFTWIVNRVFNSSRGYVHKVEVNPARAPAIDEAGIGTFSSSPGRVKYLFTISNTNNCTKYPSANIN